MQNSNKEIIIESGISTFKGLIGAVPFAGTALNELLFEARGRLKQNRINDFIKTFSEYLESLNENDLSLDQLNKDEFGDLFENLILKVAKTSSKAKLEAFKNLLVNQLIEPRKLDFTEIIIDVIGDLVDKQIIILDSYYYHSSIYVEKKKELRKYEKKHYTISEDNVKPSKNFMMAVKKKYKTANIMENQAKRIYAEKLRNDLSVKINRLNKFLKEYDKYFSWAFYNLDYSEFVYLKHSLVNKGLLIDKGLSDNFETLELLEITEFGKELIRFINSKTTNS